VQPTEFVDGNAERGPGGDHSRATTRSIKELEQSWHQLVLVLIMTQPAVATEAPREYPVLPVQDHLQDTISLSLHHHTAIIQANLR